MSKLTTFLFGASVGTVVALLTTKYDGKTMQAKLKKYSDEKIERLNILAEDASIEASLQKDNLATHYNESKENLSRVLSDTKELLSSKEDIKQAFINLKDAVTKSNLADVGKTINDFKEDIAPQVNQVTEDLEEIKAQANDLKEDLTNH